MELDEDEFHKKTNREKKLSPKLGLFWCWKCDRQIVAISEKCPSCGAVPEKKTIKKETSF